tara:strand:+ start:2587 stop:3447 length:861 start_codon:yes stop_codon:yes gene_type:complete
MNKYAFLFFYFFSLSISSSFSSGVDFYNLSPEERDIVHNLVPPSILTRMGGDVCGDRLLYYSYIRQAKHAVLKHRAPDLERAAQTQAPQEEASPATEGCCALALSSSLSLSASGSVPIEFESGKRKRIPLEEKTRKKHRESYPPIKFRIGDEHETFLESLLLEAHKNNQRPFQSRIHEKFQGKFGKIPSSTLRTYTFRAQYSLGLLDVVHTSRSQKFSGRVENFTYDLMKIGYLSGKVYTVEEMLQLLSKQYPRTNFGTEKKLQFYMRLMRQGLARQFAREGIDIP